MYQRPLSQGRLALQALYQHLLDGTRPSSKLRVVPHIVMRSNLDQFLERLSVDADPLDNSQLPAANAPRAHHR
jgi:LacI family transcriptional regulator